GRERPARELRQVPLPVDADDGLHEGTMHAELVHPVGQRGGEAAELADEVGVAEHPILQADPGLARLRGARAQHQPRKVDLPPVRRRVRTVIETELALIAEIDHFLDVAGRQFVDVAVARLDVHPIEQHLERRTQRQTPPTPTTNVINPPQLPIDLPQIPKLRLPKIQRRTSHALCPEEKAGVNDWTWHEGIENWSDMHVIDLDMDEGMVERRSLPLRARGWAEGRGAADPFHSNQ